MSEIKIRFDTDNDAFRLSYGMVGGRFALDSNEVMRILRQVGEAIHYNEYLPNKSCNIKDSNGNIVGTWKVTEDE